MIFNKLEKKYLINSLDHIVSTTIVNKKEKFTFDEIFKEIKDKTSNEKDMKKLKQKIIEKIKLFKESQLLIEFGSYYEMKKI